MQKVESAVQPSAVPSATTTPKYIRLPRGNSKDPHFSLSRAYLNSLILGPNPLVKSVCLRRPGAKRGCRLIEFSSLSQFISEQGA